jgi:hypothetical protein
MDKLVDEAVGKVEAMCAPDKMSRKEAADFLEDVVALLEASIDCLRNELWEEDNK